MRLEMAEKFNMTFVSLRNSPLDVYILLDLSSSLASILTVLQRDLTQIGELLIRCNHRPAFFQPLSPLTFDQGLVDFYKGIIFQSFFYLWNFFFYSCEFISSQFLSHFFFNSLDCIVSSVGLLRVRL